MMIMISLSNLMFEINKSILILNLIILKLLIMVTIDRLERYINNNDELYEGTVRNGYYLPSSKSSLATEDYILVVVSKTTWCPLYTDIRLLPCPRPPTKEVLIQKLMVFANTNNLTTGISLLTTYRPFALMFWYWLSALSYWWRVSSLLLVGACDL
jgi:hypothetical protein